MGMAQILKFQIDEIKLAGQCHGPGCQKRSRASLGDKPTLYCSDTCKRARATESRAEKRRAAAAADALNNTNTRLGLPVPVEHSVVVDAASELSDQISLLADARTALRADVANLTDLVERRLVKLELRTNEGRPADYLIRSLRGHLARLQKAMKTWTPPPTKPNQPDPRWVLEDSLGAIAGLAKELAEILQVSDEPAPVERTSLAEIATYDEGNI